MPNEPVDIQNDKVDVEETKLLVERNAEVLRNMLHIASTVM